MTATLTGDTVLLRPATTADIPRLAEIRATPAVLAHWHTDGDLPAELAEDLVDPELATLVVEHGGTVVGAIQWGAEEDPIYRHASIDIYLDPAVHGRGLGTDAVRTLARHLIAERGFHRLVIDPSADNAAAIACYTRVGFRPVGILRQYERDTDGKGWHDGLLMDLLARTSPPSPRGNPRKFALIKGRLTIRGVRYAASLPLINANFRGVGGRGYSATKRKSRVRFAGSMPDWDAGMPRIDVGWSSA
ncbi:RimJ/RimL family protein N-acetyltransferase [Allocatelliglobosispora scoriae]|uniref:RimJ/RimL family protein N-acetyltransferase n=1 Tax=Allocatelliglobosispora scoriae TaxID=643052 RepID=A0A841C084_9ACTN|nr:GNAT family protein [Allocatelliglobosispora scoriae]MBB5873794.1 RimJ/RimL family protein N-acetyltransferase [Allocatelliglobosispora scoriae]